MTEDKMNEIEIITVDCPRILCDPPPGGSVTTVNVVSGLARCHACDETWEYSPAELDNILMNLED